jgi:hypothetical protein
MALPDFFGTVQGTAIVWGQSGATGVTKELSFNNLANAAAQQGASADLALSVGGIFLLPDFCWVYLSVETGTAPTASLTFEAYLVSSYDNTLWPAKVTGSNGSYTLGTSDANLRQAGTPAVSLVATNDGNTVLTQVPSVWYPRGRYVAPIVDNNLGQSLRNETTPADNGSRLIVVPVYPVIVEALS